VTLVGRLTSREWNGRWYLELVAEAVSVDALTLPAVEVLPAAPAVPRADPRPERPGGTGRGRADGEVPF
jgi:hypothetical protein